MSRWSPTAPGINEIIKTCFFSRVVQQPHSVEALFVFARGEGSGSAIVTVIKVARVQLGPRDHHIAYDAPSYPWRIS